MVSMFIDPDASHWPHAHGAVLLAGDLESVPAMIDIADMLPHDAHALMLVEVFDQESVREIEVPHNVRVHWLVRKQHLETSQARGQRLGLAIHAWGSEWACAPEGETAVCTVWLAAGVPRHIVRMAQAMIEKPADCSDACDHSAEILNHYSNDSSEK